MAERRAPQDGRSGVKLLWTLEARQDRRDIGEHIAKENPAAAITMDEIFSQKARMLADHPAIGRLGRVADTRELVVHRNYLLIYDVDGENIRILRVLHARRQWPPPQKLTTTAQSNDS
jgi:toxin ParE1/3/4